MNMITGVSIDHDALDQMMPMHVLVDSQGVICHIGSTLCKILGGTDQTGRSFFRVFELRRPSVVDSIEDVCAHGNDKVYLRLRDGHKMQMIGTAACMPGQKLVLVNLSFGISVIEAVQRYGLAGSDFAPTDLTVEMLYLVEAQSAAMEASVKLSEKLHGEKTEAQAEASSDTLTGLNNRRALDLVLHRYISRRAPFTLMHLDLDFFKAVNDTLGHAAGDLVLQRVAQILIEETRDDDTVARVGGDEFVLLFPGLVDPKGVMPISHRMISRLEEPVPYRDTECRISASIGLVSSTQYDDPGADQMLNDADVALYTSKDRGRACATFYTPDMAGGEGHAAGHTHVILSEERAVQG